MPDEIGDEHAQYKRYAKLEEEQDLQTAEELYWQRGQAIATLTKELNTAKAFAHFVELERDKLREDRAANQSEIAALKVGKLALMERDKKYCNTISGLMVENLALQSRIAELEAEIKRLKSGFQGACYTCETVGELNVKLEAELSALKDAAREKIAADIDCWSAGNMHEHAIANARNEKAHDALAALLDKP